jgi:hypothetical protein
MNWLRFVGAPPGPLCMGAVPERSSLGISASIERAERDTPQT